MAPRAWKKVAVVGVIAGVTVAFIVAPRTGEHDPTGTGQTTVISQTQP